MMITKEDKLKVLEFAKDITVAEIHNLRDIDMSNSDDSIEAMFRDWYECMLNLLLNKIN